MRRTPKKIAILEPSVASECVVTEMMGQIRCGAPFLAGALAREGFEPGVFAEELISFDDSLMESIAKNYDAVGLSLALNTLPRGLQIAKALKRRNPNLLIVAGGPSAFSYADRLLVSCDAVLRGRAEATLPNFLRCSSRGDSLEAIPGIALKISGTRESEDEIFRNLEDPSVSEGLTRYDLIHGFGPTTIKPGVFGYPKPAVYSIFSSTGCIRRCKFCKTEKTYLPRNLDHFVSDLKTLLRLHRSQGLARIMLVDDCLFANLEWTKELLRKIEHYTRNQAVNFSAQFHAKQTSDNELMALFKKARFTSLAIGFESTSQLTLDGQQKGTSLYDNQLAIEQCRKFGIVPYGYFVVGFDTDTEETVDEVFDFIISKKLIAQVLPVGIMNRDDLGAPTKDADRVLSDISFGATVFVSHRPARMKASQLQTLVNLGYQRMTSLRRFNDFSTRYERAFLFAQARCFSLWFPAMERHVEVLERVTAQ